MAVKLLGRYDVVDELGRGVRGTVYLAKDTRLGKQVAIKKIGAGTTVQNEAILREARAASNLHHPNIVSLSDLGSVEGIVYLVYNFAEGELLAQMIRRAGTIPAANAVQIVADVLEALASAHAQGIVHLDIKPSNVMISPSGHASVMDFGIASAIANSTNVVARSALYMAPETSSSGGGELRSDIYSAGIMLHEMVTGLPFLEGVNSVAPSESKVKPDGRLEKIILKATAQKAANRFTSALEMRQTLQEYLDAASEAASGASDADVASTLRFLLRRIRNKSDFPAMSGIINEINQIVASETEETNKLAQIILQDFSLTNKLLKLVNTVSYSQFGGKINTISKAVSILGFETVRNIAMSLILLDFLQNKSQAQEMKDVVISSFFSGIVAVQLSEGKSAQEIEEAMICAMFLNLGRMLTKFYFFDESEEIVRIMESKGLDENQAASEVLGISYNELGIGIAKSWNFPASLIGGMQKIAGDKILEPEDNFSRLNVTVNMANDLCSITTLSDPKVKEEALDKIKTRYAGVADASGETLSSALENGLQDLSQRSKVLGLDTSKSPMVKKIHVWLAHVVEQKQSGTGSKANLDDEGSQCADAEDKLDTGLLLRDGLQDVTNTMSGEYKLNDVLQMVLETIYRAFGFKHVMIFSRDVKNNKMVARFGFGENIAAILPGFHFSLNFEADVFHLAIAKGLDVVIEDVGAANIASKIPAWHGKSVESRYFLLLPMLVNSTAVGLIYADMLEARKLQIAPAEMALLRELRNQAVLAIKQKTQG